MSRHDRFAEVPGCRYYIHRGGRNPLRYHVIAWVGDPYNTKQTIATGMPTLDHAMMAADHHYKFVCTEREKLHVKTS